MTQSVAESNIMSSVLNGRSVLVVITVPERDFRTSIREREGIQRLASGLYLITTTDEKVKSIVTRTSHVTFRRSRRISRVREYTSESGDVPTYTVVAYRFRHPSTQQKKTAERLVLRTPAVRLRPGVLLFPHLRVKDMNRYYSSSSIRLLSPKEFVEAVSRTGADVTRWSRLRIIGSSATNGVDTALDRMIHREGSLLRRRIRQIRLAIDQPETPTQKIRTRLSELSARLRLRWARLAVIEAVWHYNTQRIITSEYNMLLRLRRLLSQRSTDGPHVASQTVVMRQ